MSLAEANTMTTDSSNSPAMSGTPGNGGAADVADVASPAAADAQDTRAWTRVCPIEDIIPNGGVCALVQGRHVAVFRLGLEQLFAIDNIDPKSGASVLSRGLVGNLADRLVVASPIYKNHFDLTSGECIEAAEHSVKAHDVRAHEGVVFVALR
ncbi:MAG: nirD [Rhizobacter sp.]|nr:nirD [Rhizobacter sp.]